MKRLFKWLFGLILLAVVLLAAPVLYVETICRGEALAGSPDSRPPETHHRPEARTFMTYPEWHIVHAYDDYGQVIRSGDPHDFGYLRAIRGYWSSLCALTETSAGHGGVDGGTKQLVYVIGVSFTFELALKAAYEETIGRIAALVRGETRAPLDDLSAKQAQDYAAFLQQVPWYKWDFEADRAALAEAKTDTVRDRERNFALGLEYGAKSAYAGVIASAVESTGQDQLTLRMIVTGQSEAVLSAMPDIRVVGTRLEGVEIETPRYRKLTGMIAAMAKNGVTFVEIAGNDDILLTALSDTPTHETAIHSFARQGYSDYRHLIALKVVDLAEALESMAQGGLTLEHIHDY